MDDPLRIARHEASHAWAGLRTGRKVGPVTVRAGRRWAGGAHYGPVRVDGRAWARLDASRPVACWPGPIRRRFDIDAICAAAGAAGEELLSWAVEDPPSRRPEPAVDVAIELIAEPSRREELRLAAQRSNAGGHTDAEKVAMLAEALYPDGARQATAWVGWVHAEAAALVAEGAVRIERLALVLDDRGSLSGRAVREVLESPC
jgi:hypothetical protein